MSSSDTEHNTNSKVASVDVKPKKHKKVHLCNICHEKLTKDTFIRCV